MPEPPRRVSPRAERRTRLALLCCLVTGIADASAGAAAADGAAVRRATAPPETRDRSPTSLDAEFAIRWNPAEGGPAAAEQVLALLGLPMPTPKTYLVRYFDVPRPATAPARAAVILRGRTQPGGKTQIRLKYRLDQPLAGSWACPPGSPFEQSSEVDVTWLPSGPPKRVFAYSCTLKAAAPPPSLNAAPKACAAEMTRYAAGGFKVEAWRMPKGETQLEVSRAGPDTPEELTKFATVAKTLIGRGAKPTGYSKTELGSACP